MSTQLQYANGTVQTLQDNTSSTVTSGSAATAATAYDNSNTSNGYLYGDFEMQATFGTAPTASSTIELYLTEAVDGTNYADTDNTTPNYNLLAGMFVCRGVTSAQRILLPRVPLPPGLFKAYVRNQTNQSLPAGWILKCLPYRETSV